MLGAARGMRLLRGAADPNLFATGQVDAGYVTAAWIFVVFRVLHSAVHCTFNHVMLRFYLYLIATLAVWFMVLRAALAFFRTY